MLGWMQDGSWRLLQGAPVLFCNHVLSEAMRRSERLLQGHTPKLSSCLAYASVQVYNEFTFALGVVVACRDECQNDGWWTEP